MHQAYFPEGLVWIKAEVRPTTVSTTENLESQNQNLSILYLLMQDIKHDFLQLMSTIYYVFIFVDNNCGSLSCLLIYNNYKVT